MSDLVTELHIVGDDNNIFDTDMEYIIPLYQRAYAWEDKQLVQLIEDINDVADDANYYIGALIVSRQGNKFEVVDGQQRLTSLYLLLNCLGYEVQNTLTFACRDKSNYTLQSIQKLIQMNRSKLDMDRIESGIQSGIKILMQEMQREGFDKDEFCEKLSRVVVYRIEVPENTDLNRYFEIMNTRGEQLEQHDILKASLMSYLKDEKDKAIFAKIWDACSDMTGYIQMHFISKGNEVRTAIFGWDWTGMPSESWTDYKNEIEANSLNGVGHTIEEIINADFRVDTDDGYLDDDIRVRFESVIEFPYFLIHTLKVYIAIKGISHENGESKIIDELLDDKKLIESFNRVTTYGVNDKGRIDKETFSREFIICLLRTRFLFDKYIVKREYANENADGEWSLKSLYASGQQSKKKPCYRNTGFAQKGERNQEKRSNERNKRNIMLQSALRVSYTSPKVMHWITQLLIWLSKDNCANDLSVFSDAIEKIAKDAVREQFFEVCKDGVYAMGVSTPHIVFNYLDYLLWMSEPKKYDDFTFEFRNSVEHWYPQNPSEGTFESWTDGVDQFGNLCIIQRNVNSKFSNMSPEAKKSTFKEMISKGSIKLRIMSELTEKGDGKVASLYWKDTLYEEHGKDMIDMLYRACHPEDE